jgi:hypothetical protein
MSEAHPIFTPASLPAVCVEWRRRWGVEEDDANLRSPPAASSESGPGLDVVGWALTVVDRVVRELAPLVVEHYGHADLGRALRELEPLGDAASCEAAAALLQACSATIARAGHPYWMLGSMKAAVEEAAVLRAARDPELWEVCLGNLFGDAATLDMAASRSFKPLTRERVTRFFQPLAATPVPPITPTAAGES